MAISPCSGTSGRHGGQLLVHKGAAHPPKLGHLTERLGSRAERQPWVHHHSLSIVVGLSFVPARSPPSGGFDIILVKPRAPVQILPASPTPADRR